MSDSSSSPVNPFVFLCLLLVVVTGGLSIWSELSPNSLPSFLSKDTESETPSTETPSTESSPPTDAVQTPVANNSTPSQVSNSATTDEPSASEAVQPDTFPDAVKRASLAYGLSESAQSKDDWLLVVGRWQQAIALMEAVPPTSPHYGEVSAKLADYRRSQAYAQRQAGQPVPTNTVTGVVDLGGEDEEGEGVTPATGQSGDNPDTESVADGSAGEDSDGAEASTNNANQVIYRAPIVRRSGGTPVIQVRFNGEHTVEMIVDTGASGTVITQKVAQALGVRATGRTNVSTASAQNVSFLLGKVDSIGVDGVELTNVVVAIAGPDLDTGLLGNDFFGHYDVTVRADVVEFHER